MGATRSYSCADGLERMLQGRRRERDGRWFYATGQPRLGRLTFVGGIGSKLASVQGCRNAPISQRARRSTAAIPTSARRTVSSMTDVGKRVRAGVGVEGRARRCRRKMAMNRSAVGRHPGWAGVIWAQRDKVDKRAAGIPPILHCGSKCNEGTFSYNFILGTIQFSIV